MTPSTGKRAYRVRLELQGKAYGKTQQVIKRKKRVGEVQYWAETRNMVDRGWRHFYDPRGFLPAVPNYVIL